MAEKFIDSPVCRSRAHCRACQDPSEHGRRFRLSLLRVELTGLPEDGSVMACPHGMTPATAAQTTPSPAGGGPHVPTPRPVGVGRVLARLLKRFGVGEVEGCLCGARAAEMDRRGPAGCWASRAEILGWLAEEAGRRQMTYRPWAARGLLLTAIVVAWYQCHVDEMTKGTRAASDGGSKTV